MCGQNAKVYIKTNCININHYAVNVKYSVQLLKAKFFA